MMSSLCRTHALFLFFVVTGDVLACASLSNVVPGTLHGNGRKTEVCRGKR